MALAYPSLVDEDGVAIWMLVSVWGILSID